MTRAPGVTTLATERGERGMEITRTVEVYTLDELSDEARARAVSRMRDQAWEFLESDWVSESVYGRFAELATGNYDYGADLRERFGVDVSWSVGYTQSDGADLCRGRLRREDAPLLAWPDGVGGVELDYEGRLADYWGIEDESGDSAEVPEGSYDALRAMLRGIGRTLYDTARAAVEDYTSEESVVMRYDDGVGGDRRRFLADGSEAPEAFWSDDEA